MNRRRWLLGQLLALLALPWATLVVAACFTTLPAALSAESARTTVLVLDRDGRLLREVAIGSGAPENPLTLAEVSPWVVPALLAAEDSRFFQHPGVDPVSVGRAAGQLLVERRVVSGASTLTQQLARTLEPRPRSVLGKLREMAQALRIEASLSKSRILEEYLSRVEFGPNLVGIQAASRHYFGKNASSLDLSEAAALVAMPRGPSLYDPRRRPQLLERRRLRVLGRMAELGLASPEEIARAELTPLRVMAAPRAQGAEHLTFALASRYGGGAGDRTRSLRTTLSSELQREAEKIAEASLPNLTAHGGDAMSLVALDNATGDVLAYVGSPSYFDEARQGANDGVVARRQPGSALKPFAYAAAMQELGYGPATLLPDLPRDYAVANGSFAPKNYDQHFRGPVLLRQALGSSLNMPALEVTSRLGPARLLQLLHQFGFASLDRPAEHYGVGLALGDGEVTLLELASAYSALARGGELLPARVVLGRSVRGGVEAPRARPPARRVLAPEYAALLSDMLSDDAARSAGFGRDSVLNLPFPVAAKTGTSKGYRDNWAVGYTREVTVAVWVGNFDGTPLQGASGITSAGPAFHDLMLAAMRGREPAPLYDASLLVDAEVCTLSGLAPTAACPHRRREHFARGHEPRQTCDIHVRCGEQVRERFAEPFRAWAAQAGRPLASPDCSPASDVSTPRITFPRDEQRFALDADGPRRQEIVLTATASSERARFVIDGALSREQAAPFRLPLPLTPGVHRVRLVAGGVESPLITFTVAAP